MTTEYQPPQLSQYNEASQQTQRRHEIKLKCIEYRRKGKLSAWNFELDNFWLELCGDRNLRKVRPNAIEEFKKFWTEYSKVKSNRSKTYEVLFRKEQYLRILEDQLGKGSKYQKKDDSGM